MAAATICICSQSACDAGVVNEASLHRLAAQADLKVRKMASAPADMLINKAGSPALAFLLWRQPIDGSSTGAGGMASSALRLANAFRHAYVLVPYELMSSPAVVDAISSLGCDEGPTFVFMPICAEFTERVLALAKTMLQAKGEEAAWRKQQVETAATSEAVNHVLLGLPLPVPEDGDAAHQANMLRMLGSLQHISHAAADEIAEHADLSRQEANRIAAFFRRGERDGGKQGGHLPQQLMQAL